MDMSKLLQQGVGTRTAQRLAFHLLQRPKDEALALASAIADVKERVRFCRECGNLTEDEVCAICTDARRDHSVICVVEQPVDLISVERTSEFRGLYHVLGGALSPIDGVEPEHLRIDELLGRVERNGVLSTGSDRARIAARRHAGSVHLSARSASRATQKQIAASGSSTKAASKTAASRCLPPASSVMSNHASTQSSVPAIAATGASQSDRRTAVTATATKAAAWAKSKPAQTVL